MAEVRVQDGESVENALRRFKRKVQTEDIIKEVKRHSFYLKPGEKKRVKQALARKRSRKKQASGAEKSSAETPSRADENRTAQARISHRAAEYILQRLCVFNTL